jgi:hypothetical protein
MARSSSLSSGGSPRSGIVYGVSCVSSCEYESDQSSPRALDRGEHPR